MVVTNYGLEGNKNPYKNCKDEQDVKRVCIDTLRKNSEGNHHFFCIETSETILGFPDVMIINKRNNQASFYEFKVARKDGVIKFEKDQIRFYKMYKDLDIFIAAFDFETQILYDFRVSEIFEGENLRLNANLTVILP